MRTNTVPFQRYFTQYGLGIGMLMMAISVLSANPVTTYTYTGKDFTTAIAGETADGPLPAPWTTSDFISASFTFASPLGDNLPLTNVTADLESWTISDGVNTYNPGDTLLGLTEVELATGPTGNITAWLFETGTFGDPNSFSPSSYSNLAVAPGKSSDNAGEIPPPTGLPGGGSSYGPAARNSNDPGVWNVVTATSTVPEPAPTVVIALGGAILLLASRRRQRKPSASQKI